MGVHERRGIGPERVVEPVGQDGQGLEEFRLEAGIRPPGVEPDVHEASGPLRVAVEESEHLRRGTEKASEPRLLEEDRPVKPVVEHPPGAQRRQGEQDGQQRGRRR